MTTFTSRPAIKSSNQTSVRDGAYTGTEE